MEDILEEKPELTLTELIAATGVRQSTVHMYETLQETKYARIV